MTSLALHAGWLYGGTLIAALIVCVRKIRLMAERRRPGRPTPSRQQTTGPKQREKRVPAV
ncbi:hypothetical protein [Streptomyces flavofungini]|uniref:hypothetical protein n=1 Tax=Streptomyces flavofungini TaxID=68200 RepID=UPI003F812A79